MVRYSAQRCRGEAIALRSRSGNVMMERMKVMDKIKVTDDEIIVDKMIAASQGKKELLVHPSFGRDLVPYFVPGAGKDPNEGDINVSTDVDAHRRNGASVMDIPLPVSSNGTPAQIAARARGKTGRSERRKTSPEGGGAHSDGAKKNLRGAQRARKRSAASVGSDSEVLDKMSQRHQEVDSHSSGSEEQEGSCKFQQDIERWAGPAFSNSPNPCDLPIPTFSCQGSKQSAGLRSSRLEQQDAQAIQPQSLLDSFSRAAAVSTSPPSAPSTVARDVHTTTVHLRKLLNLSSPVNDLVCSDMSFATKDLRRALGLEERV